MSTITIYASCHCKTFDHAFDIPASAFPLKSSLCHCNLCRHSLGHAFGTFAVIPLPYSRTPSTKGLVGYKSSGKLTRWFCQTCGASCWNDDRTAGDEEISWEWEVCTGLVDKVMVDGQLRKEVIGGLLNRVQMWVEDTTDGGASIWVNGGLLDDMDRRLVGRQSEVVTDEETRAFCEWTSQGKANNNVGDSLSAVCNCQAIKLSITRNEGEKYEAGLDACESCRKVTGSEITAWATIPEKNIQFADGRELDLKSDCFGEYFTSPGVLRLFCKDCGATVFYKKPERVTIDVGVGLIRAEGVRAEDWLDWNKYGSQHVAYKEDTVDREFVDGLVRGCEERSKHV